MRNAYLLVLFLYSVIYAQEVQYIKVIATVTGANKKVVVEQTNKGLEERVVDNTDQYDTLPTTSVGENTYPTAYRKDKINIRFYKYDVATRTLGEELTRKQSGINTIQVFVGNEARITDTIAKNMEQENDKGYDLYLDKTQRTPINTTVRITYNLEKNTNIKIYNGNNAYYKHYKLGSLYDPSPVPSLWLPTGMFASNFTSGPDGIPFAPMPIGAASGIKFNTPKGYYIGTSACLNWLIYEKENESDAKFTISSIAPGVLIDVNNWFTFGCVYGIDLTTNKEHPGFSLLVGIAPNLLNFLKQKN